MESIFEVTFGKFNVVSMCDNENYSQKCIFEL
jgi:hypothetical protein